MHPRSWWPIKLIMFVGLITAGFFVPESFFQAYGYICIILGIGFLLFQAVIMLDFAYVFAEVRSAMCAPRGHWLAGLRTPSGLGTTDWPATRSWGKRTGQLRLGSGHALWPRRTCSNPNLL